MNTEKTLLDADGTSLQEGDLVVFLSAPDELLSNLPSEDQSAIRAQVGKSLTVQGFDQYGHVELEFKSEEGAFHSIWVKPSYLRKSGS